MVAKADISNFGFGCGYNSETGKLTSRTGMIDQTTESFFGSMNHGALLFMKFGGQYFQGFIRGGLNLMCPFATTVKDLHLARVYIMGHFSTGVSYRF